MGKPGKRYKEAKESYNNLDHYTVSESIVVVKKLSTAKFDETIEIAISLGVDPKHSDQIVRGTCMLPHGTGKNVRVLVFARGEKAEEAKESGADYVGDDDLAEKIQSGWLDFDVVITTPDMMKVVGKLGRVLGPRGLMPNPKTGTVTADIATAVNESKAGKISFRTDKTGNLHAPIGKASFDEKKLEENALKLLEKILILRPSSAKGRYLNSVTICSTMSPGVRIDVGDIRARLR